MAYNPGISYRGGEILGNALADAGASIAGGIQQRNQNREMRRRIEGALNSLNPERKDEYAAMGLGELQGELDGMTMKRANELRDMQLQTAKSNAETARLNAERLQEETAAAELQRQMAAEMKQRRGVAMAQAINGDAEAIRAGALQLAEAGDTEGAQMLMGMMPKQAPTLDFQGVPGSDNVLVLQDGKVVQMAAGAKNAGAAASDSPVVKEVDGVQFYQTPNGWRPMPGGGDRPMDSMEMFFRETQMRDAGVPEAAIEQWKMEQFRRLGVQMNVPAAMPAAGQAAAAPVNIDNLPSLF